ncbi:MAG: ParA family protein [Gammaproteobacteria bacterium]|nr:ParA family protein [Gammaproteobacteria bacterium]
MTKIIGFVQLKGGVGRSTLATNLAGTMAETAKVALIDCDAPQYTCSHWLQQRNDLYEIDEQLDLYQPATYKELLKLLQKLDGQYDYIIIDCPPRIDGFSRVALMLSNLVLLPLGASAAEIWSIEAMLPVLKEAKQINSNIDARIVWNRFRGYTRSANENAEHAKKDLKLPEMRQKLGLRVAYCDAMADGLTVHETNDNNARVEIWSLNSSVRRLLSKQKKTRKLSDDKVLAFAKKH